MSKHEGMGWILLVGVTIMKAREDLKVDVNWRGVDDPNNLLS